MSATTDSAFFLPGLMPRKQFAAQMGKCERTIKRWEDAGLIVVLKIGNERLIDVQKSLDRIRGERPNRRRAA